MNETIAEKLQIIAENEQKVYEAGREKGFQNGFESGYTDGYSLGESAGRQAERDEFWDSYQDYGERTGYNFLFSGTGWNDELYNPKYPINMITQSNNVYQYNSTITDTKVPIYVSHTASQSMFYYCTSLKTIPSITVTEGVIFSYWFTGCKALETILFTEGSVIGNNISFSSCVVLSKQSIETIVNALSLNVGEKTLTLSKTAVNSAFETSEGAADGSTSEAWLSLVATKSNWTISLV